MGEVINWEEKYVSYVEGDLRRDIQELKDGQKTLDAKIDNGLKTLDAKIDARVQELKDGQKALDAKVEKVVQELKDGQRTMDAKIDDVRKELSAKIDRVTYIILGAFGVALIGGLIKLFIG